MRRAVACRALAFWGLASLFVGAACSGPTPAPMPLKREPGPVREDVAPPQIPKFDVAPPGSLKRPAQRPPPPGFSDLAVIDATIRLDMRYATPDNFTGTALPGYLPGASWLTTPAAEALRAVHEALAPQGLGLLVFDAYRPVRATKAMVRWAEATGNTKVLDDGYVGRLSNHNRGNTVDLTLVNVESGKELDMGVPWDTFSEASHYANATGDAAKNRRTLRAAMTKHGFAPYDKEWWHFTFTTEPEPPALDVPYAVE